jgi:PAS domain S-box-containing protein
MIDFFEFSNEMLCLADQRGYFTRVNQAWTKTLGWSVGELTSRPYIEFVHPDDVKATTQEARRLLGDGETVQFENRYRCLNGSYRWLSWQAQYEPGSNQLVGTARDVTDEKSKAEALRESEERFRTLATHAPIGIAQSDAEGSIFFVNSEWCDLAGVTPQEAMGFQWKNFIHHDDRDGLIQAWQSSLQAGNDMSAYEFRFLHSNGDIRWASTSVSLLKKPDGSVVGQIASIQDITERKAAENALRTKESQLRGIVDNAAAVIYLKDLQGRYLLVNHRHQTLFHHDGDSIIGKTDLEFFPEATAKTFIESDKEVIQAQAPLVFEEVALHDDGPHTYRSVKFPIKDDTGMMVALGGISTDITDLKESHDALNATQKVLRNLIDVQENEKRFLCHEFHDGLIQYAFGASLLLEGYRRKHTSMEDSEQIDTAVSKLRKGVEDGRRVIRGIRPAMLDDSNIEAAINDLIEQFSNSDIMVTFKCDPNIGRLPESVQTTIYRVVQEALNNARKYSGTDVVRIELQKSDGDLHLEIRDFGCGFDVESARKRGFGLLGMNERVRLLGGDFSILSEKDAGTTITARLPISLTNAAPP